MSDSQSSLNSPASPTKLEILDGTFVLTWDRLDSETMILSAQDNTVSAAAALVGVARNSFEGALSKQLS